MWQDGPCAQVSASLRPVITTRLTDAEHRAAQLADPAVAEQRRRPGLDLRLHLHVPHLHLEITARPGDASAGLIDRLLGPAD